MQSLDKLLLFFKKVLKVKESATEVFALDYGCTLSVVKSEIYTLPEDLELSVCPQCASLCSILGKDIWII